MFASREISGGECSMRRRRVLVGISLIVFLVAFNVFLYAQPSLEELTRRIESLEEAMRELTKSSTEKDDIISFLREQQSSVFQNASIALENVDRAIANLTVNVDRLSDLMTAVVVFIGVAFPIVTFFIQSKLDKKRIDQVHSRLDEVREEAKKTGEELQVKLEQAKNSLDERIEKALSISSEAKKWADKSKASEFFNRAYSAMATLSIDEQVQLYSEAIKLDPENAEAYFQRGTCYHKMKEYDLALHDYSQSIELNPKNVLSYLNRGIVNVRKGEFDRAMSDYLHAIDVDPKQAIAYNSLADLLRITNKLDEAERYARKAIEIDPKLSYSYGTLSEIYSDLNDNGKFYEFLEAALKRGFPLSSVLEYDEQCRQVYAKHKDEEPFKELMKKYKIEIPDDVWE